MQKYQKNSEHQFPIKLRKPHFGTNLITFGPQKLIQYFSQNKQSVQFYNLMLLNFAHLAQRPRTVFYPQNMVLALFKLGQSITSSKNSENFCKRFWQKVRTRRQQDKLTNEQYRYTDKHFLSRHKASLSGYKKYR